MSLLKVSSRIMRCANKKSLREVTDEDIEKHMAKPGSDREFIRRMESGEIRHVCWDMDIPYKEFKARVEAGYYDEK